MSRRLPPLVLGYHGVGRPSARAADPHALLTSERALRRHLRVLRSWGYELLTFGALAARHADGGAHGCAAITFDDGLASLATLPGILEGTVPATVFAVSTWLDAPHPDLEGMRTLDADGLRALAAAGIEIGSHSETHPDLEALGYEKARKELEHSKSALEALLQQPVETAAYPYGRADEQTRHACRDAGFRAACRTTGQGSWEDPFDLPRQDMDEWSNRVGLRLKRDNRYEVIMRWRPARALRAVGRVARSALA